MKLRYIILSFLLVLNPLAVANKLFVSNNSSRISPYTAYTRLNGTAQENLITDTTRTLQEDHYGQGTLSNGLGAYTMHEGNTLTADNTLVFTTSPLDTIDRDKIIETATKLANQLNQESVAAFVDGFENNIDITVTINSNMTYQQLTDKLTQLESHGLVAFTFISKAIPSV